MEHAKEIELIELVAKRLDGDRENTLLIHVQDCAVCRSRLEEIRRTWDILGAWEVLPTGHLDMGKPVPPSDSVGRALAMPILRLRRVGMVLRIAATIAVAVLAGYAAGRWSGNAPSAGESGSPQYVSALGLETGGSLSSLVLPDELPPGGEGWHEAP